MSGLDRRPRGRRKRRARARALIARSYARPPTLASPQPARQHRRSRPPARKVAADDSEFPAPPPAYFRVESCVNLTWAMLASARTASPLPPGKGLEFTLLALPREHGEGEGRRLPPRGVL